MKNKLDYSWAENFITYDEDRNKFIAWDETQAGELGDFDTWVEALEEVLSYADSLSYDEKDRS